MTRLARAFQGEDSVPVTDFTDSIVWEECEFVQVADNGQSATSRVVILDTEADIPNVQTGKYLTSHNVFTVDDGPFRLFRGRVESFDWNRGHDEGKRLGPYTRFMDVTLSDYNRDLDGIVVHDFNRPEETDYARVQAVVATYLKGSPRTTTNLISSNYVSSSNSITVAAKVYRGTTPREILTELASTADKVVFVDVDGNLHYEGKDSTLFSSGLRISDDPADASAVTYGPIFTEGAPATHDGTELWSNLRYYYGGSSTGTGTVSNTNAPIYGYWESVQWNQRAGKAASALADAGGLLAEHKYNRVTLTVTIGPLPWGHLGSLKAGQIIQMKSKWLLGGKDAAGAYVYQGFLNYRIAELRWRPVAVDTYMATLRLDREPKTFFKSTGSQALTVAQPPQQPAPYDFPVVDYLWTFDADEYDTTHTYPVGSGSWHPGGYISSGVLGTGPGNYSGTHVPVSAGSYHFRADIARTSVSYNAGGIAIELYATVSGVPTLMWTSSLVTAILSSTRVETDVTFPAGTTEFMFRIQYNTSAMYEIALTHGTSSTSVTPTSAPPAASDGTGSIGTNQGIYANADHSHPAQAATVTPIGDAGGYYPGNETVEEALQQIGEGVPLVKLLANKSGGAVLPGDVVKTDDSNESAFTTNTTLDFSDSQLMIVQDIIQDGGTGRVLLSGYAARVNIGSNAGTRGHRLYGSNMAKRAYGSNARSAGAFGIMLSSNADPPAIIWSSTDPSGGSGGGAALGAWTNYTPTWSTASGTAPSLGNGTLLGRYKVLDATSYFVVINFTAGSTTTFGNGGTWQFTLPFTATSGAGRVQILAGWIVDSGTDNKLCVGKITPASPTLVGETVPEGANVVNNTNPMTWTTNDQLTFNGIVEV